MATKFSSSDDLDISSSETVFRLCSLDQKNPGSCPPSSCSNLHMCREYLLTNECEIFKLRGKCFHSHSLFTQHNQKVLKNVFKLSANDEDTFDRVAKLIKKSVSNRSSRSDDQDFVSSGDQTSSISSGRGRGQPPVQLRKISSDHPTAGRLSISPRLTTLTNSDYSQTNSERFSTSLNLDTMKSHHDRGKSSTMHSLGAQENDDSSDGSSSKRSSSRHGKSILSSFVSKVKDNLSPKPNRNTAVEIIPQSKYVFDRYNRDDELSYLHGPLRRYLLDKRYPIFSSGYCRLTNADQEKEIQKKITAVFPQILKVDPVQLPNAEFGVFICTSAAEKIFEQIHNKDKPYSIISKPYSGSFSIEVIRSGKADSSASSSRFISPRTSMGQETTHMSTPNGTFRIPQTNSSIDVIRGDITSTQVDLMVCVTTSVTLLSNVLVKAGPATATEYKNLSYSKNLEPCSGGHTSAQKILFVPWKLEVESSDSKEAQKSLSNLVQRCIDEAHRLNMRSIAFPSIGTGKIGLDPNKVSQTMINAANECLQHNQMDVLFVIHSSGRSNDPNEQSYQMFRYYLDTLGKHSKTGKAEASSGGLTIPVVKTKQIPVDRECKRIFTVSDSLDMTLEHRQLLKSLEKLIVEKTIKLSHIQKQFFDEVESLIDLCLDYHVIPHIDYVKDELTVRGDRHSCSQCLFNLQNQPKIHKYSIYKKTRGRTEKIDLSIHVSMKIDEAFVNEEQLIIIRDGSDTMLHVDLDNYKVKINDDPQQFGLEREELNIDRRIDRPSTWSSPSSMIRTIDVSSSSSASKKPLRLFGETMPSTEWLVDRIDAIENWPLYVHCNGSEIKDETFAFHGCSYSSVQSIIHYGLHSNHGQRTDDSIQLNDKAFDSHVQNARRSTTGQYYMFLVRSEKRHFNKGSAKLSNDNAHLALPTHLIVYRRWTDAE